MSETEFTPDEPEPDTEPAAPPTSDPEEEPTTDEPDEPDTAQPEEPSSFALMEKRGKSLDLLSKHVAKRIGEIFGDDVALLEECEVCTYFNTPGWRPSGPLPQAVEDVLHIALRQSSPRNMAKDEFSRECEKCNGEGSVLTGSKVQGQETLPCMRCKGLGWQPVGPERATGAFAAVNGPAALPPPALTLAAPPAPEDPAIAAAKALLQEHGHMVIPMSAPVT